MTAIKRGDRAAFQRLYQVLAPPLYARILLPRLGDPAAAEEALADTFARAVERLDSYQDRGGSIWSWLVTIAANRALDLHRERARDGRALAGFQALLAPILGDARGAARRGARPGEAARRGGGGAGPAQPALPARAGAAILRGARARSMRRRPRGQDRDLRRAAVARAARVSRGLARLGSEGARCAGAATARRCCRTKEAHEPERRHEAKLEPEPTAEERAEAEALARALERGAPGAAPPPDDALAAAALLRHARRAQDPGEPARGRRAHRRRRSARAAGGRRAPPAPALVAAGAAGSGRRRRVALVTLDGRHDDRDRSRGWPALGRGAARDPGAAGDAAGSAGAAPRTPAGSRGARPADARLPRGLLRRPRWRRAWRNREARAV